MKQGDVRLYLIKDGWMERFQVRHYLNGPEGYTGRTTGCRHVWPGRFDESIIALARLLTIGQKISGQLFLYNSEVSPVFNYLKRPFFIIGNVSLFAYGYSSIL